MWEQVKTLVFGRQIAEQMRAGLALLSITYLGLDIHIKNSLDVLFYK